MNSFWEIKRVFEEMNADTKSHLLEEVGRKHKERCDAVSAPLQRLLKDKAGDQEILLNLISVMHSSSQLQYLSAVLRSQSEGQLSKALVDAHSQAHSLGLLINTLRRDPMKDPVSQRLLSSSALRYLSHSDPCLQVFPFPFFFFSFLTKKDIRTPSLGSKRYLIKLMGENVTKTVQFVAK